MATELSLRDRVLRRITALETERQSFWGHWKAINDVLLPRSGRFFVTDTNRGERKNDILDDTGTDALTTLGAGMQAGQTSPARPWVKLETEDTDLMESAAVSKWLDVVNTKIMTVFARSNTYRALHQGYEELGAFGTWATVVMPDFNTVIHHHPLTIGEYCLAANDKNEIDTLGRRLQMTVHQIVQRYVAPYPRADRQKSDTWDWSRVSPSVKNLWDAHNVDAWIPLYHLIEPRLDGDAEAVNPKRMPWSSITIETGGRDNMVLNESGYRRFPVLAPRWVVTGNDVYGSSCPGMRALGSILQLQQEQTRKLQGIDFKTMPPLQVPSSLKNTSDTDFLPGGVSYVDQVGPQNGIRTAFDVNLDLQHLLLDIQDVRELIKRAFFADVFLAMQSRVGLTPITARQVEEEHEEKLMMLGPVIERQQNELLAPLVDIVFDRLMETGALPPPPEELSDQPLKTTFVSILAQAQRRASMAGVDRIISATASIAAAKQDPSVWDNIDTDKAINKAAGYEQVDPEIIRGADQVQQIRLARQQAEAQAAQAESAKQAAETAKTLAGAPMNTDNALTQLVSGFATQ